MCYRIASHDYESVDEESEVGLGYEYQRNDDDLYGHPPPHFTLLVIK